MIETKLIENHVDVARLMTGLVVPLAVQDSIADGSLCDSDVVAEINDMLCEQGLQDSAASMAMTSMLLYDHFEDLSKASPELTINFLSLDDKAGRMLRVYGKRILAGETENVQTLRTLTQDFKDMAGLFTKIAEHDVSTKEAGMSALFKALAGQAETKALTAEAVMEAHQERQQAQRPTAQIITFPQLKMQ